MPALRRTGHRALGDSTSLRVLRGLEEEAQKQRSESLVMRVAADVAMYTLNQKRRELARLESDYDITISFDPKEDLKAGDFDIERIGQRDPESRPKPAILIEAAPELDEPEPEIVEEDEPQDETQDEPQTEARRNEPQGGDVQGEAGGRRRRRRRRGGRGRDRDRPSQPGEPRQASGPQPQQILSPADGTALAESEGSGEIPAPVNGAAPQLGEGEQQFGDGGPRRKRRRRRGRRGGRDRANLSPGEQRPDNDAPLESRFGSVDEIDTTPRDEPRGTPVNEPPLPLHVPQVAPNAASTPVWSLRAEGSEPTPSERKPVKASVAEPADGGAPEASQSTKKGWWQRTFRTD